MPFPTVRPRGHSLRPLCLALGLAAFGLVGAASARAALPHSGAGPTPAPTTATSHNTPVELRPAPPLPSPAPPRRLALKLVSAETKVQDTPAGTVITTTVVCAGEGSDCPIPSPFG